MKSDRESNPVRSFNSFAYLIIIIICKEGQPFSSSLHILFKYTLFFSYIPSLTKIFFYQKKIFLVFWIIGVCEWWHRIYFFEMMSRRNPSFGVKVNAEKLFCCRQCTPMAWNWPRYCWSIHQVPGLPLLCCHWTQCSLKVAEHWYSLPFIFSNLGLIR